MNNFNQPTIDYINTQQEIFNDDFNRLAETLLETKDMEQKKQLVLELVALAHNYEMIDKYHESYNCLETAYASQLEICSKLPTDSGVHMHLWVMALMNAHVCYKLNAYGTAIQYCQRFADVVKDIVKEEEAPQNMLDIAYKAHLDLGILYYKLGKKEKAKELLDIANGISEKWDEFPVSIERLNLGYYERISFNGNLGDTYANLIMNDMASDYKHNRYNVYQSISSSVPYDKALQLAYLESAEKLSSVYEENEDMETALEYAVECKEMAMTLQATYPDDDKMLNVLFEVNSALHHLYKSCDMHEEMLDTAKDMYHLALLLQDEDMPTTREVIIEFGSSALGLAKQYEELGQNERALKYYKQSLKWSEMLDDETELVESLKGKISRFN